jgi:hypothetical protein
MVSFVSASREAFESRYGCTVAAKSVVAVEPVADASPGRVVQEERGRPTTATAAVAAPPRSRLRREICGYERCSLMAGVLLTGWVLFFMGRV